MSIIPFTFPETEQPVRVVTIDDDPWFVASDVTAVLGYANGRMAIGSLPERMKSSVTIADGTPGNPNRTIVSEPGVYRLVMRSTLAAAERFQDWLAEEVIPSIRKTGSYGVAQRELSPRDLALMVIAEADRADAAELKAAALEPAARAWGVLASGDGDYAVADAAKILSRDPAIETGRNRLFGILHELDWAYVQNADHRYRAKQYAVDRRWLSELPQSYTHPRTGEVTLGAPQLRVTAKGLAELHKRLGGTAPVQIPAVSSAAAIEAGVR